jgi:hypothetical protein
MSDETITSSFAPSHSENMLIRIASKLHWPMLDLI